MAVPVYIRRDDVPKGGAHVVEVNPGLRIAVFRSGEAFHAINDRCPHAGGPLAEGPSTDASSPAPCTASRST